MTDTIYSKAKISKETKCVNLWLGANTMVEFTYAEAQKLLKKNLENAKSNLKTFVYYFNILIFKYFFLFI